MPKWNEQQRRAVETRERNILVSASAGSGKTTVLVGRLMDLVIKDKISVDQILAMTFTEAAANEMKKRLSASLQQEIAQTQDEKILSHLRRQLTLLQDAQISTIHSFCLSILQRYYYVIGCSARQIQNIADSAQMEGMRQNAMEQTLNLHQGNALSALAKLFSMRIEEKKDLCGAIETLAAMAGSSPDPQQWLDQCILPYRCTSLDDLPADIRRGFFSYLKLKQTQISQALAQIKDLFFYDYPEKTAHIEKINLKDRLYQQAEEALNAMDYEGYRRAFITSSAQPMPRTPNKDDLRYARFKDMLVESEDALASILFDSETLLHDLHDSAGVVETLVACTRTYLEVYQKLKQQAQVIDFDDMEHFALQILTANDHAIAKEYQKRFSVIMVDEFQDSNDIQDTIVQLIARSNNVFRVGDVKQSIYGFRHARPQIMQSYIDHPKETDEVIYLSNNYRSSETLVEFNNVFYQKLMNLPSFSSSYRTQDCVSIGGPWQQAVKEPIHFQALLLNELKEQEAFTNMNQRQIKALWIASQIKKMHEERKLAWKDFVVLVRSNHNKDDLRTAFDQLHLPYFIEIKHGFYQSSAIELILSALAFLRDPHDDIAFASIALSPLLDFNENQLAQARLKRKDKESFYQYFSSDPDASFQALDAVLKKRNLPIHSLLNELYDLNDYYSTSTSLQEKTNLDLLYQQAVAFEQEQSSDLYAFIDFIDSIKDAQSGEANPISSDDDVIRVMSIHQSKGLQFPIVFLWSNHAQAALDFRSPFLFDPDLGIGIRSMDSNCILRPSIVRIAMQHKKDREQLEEEMRILYVATTRAQNEMYIVDCIRSLELYQQELTTASVFSRCGYTGWFLQAFSQEPSALFHLETVTSSFDTAPLEKTRSEKQAIRHYEKQSSVLSGISASQRKQKQSFPLFDPKASQSTGAMRGTMLHEIAAGLLPPFSDEQIITLFKDKGIEPAANDLRQLHELIIDPQYIRWCAYPHVYRELPYSARIKDELLYGYIDFMAVNEKEIIIIDYKSDHLEDSAAFVDNYAIQLQTYADAVRTMYPDHMIQTWIYSFYLSKFITVDLK